MKLADWMHANRATPGDLRRELGVNGRSTVERWLDGTHTPSPPYMRRIETLTGGRVRPADFEDPDPPACAVEVTLADGHTRLVFPWTKSDRLMDAARDLGRAESPEGEATPCPVRRALAALAGRARPTRRGQYLLDGRVCDARRLVRAANAVLIARGDPPIRYPGVEADANAGKPSTHEIARSRGGTTGEQ